MTKGVLVPWVGLFPRWRGGHGEPEEIGGTGVFRVRNRIVDLYAARVKGGGVVLFDTGMDPAGRPVDALLRAVARSRDDVTHVLLTHAHPDHVAAVPLFSRARVFLGAPDADRLAHRTRGRAAVRVFEWVFPTRAVERVSDPLEGRTVIDLEGERVLAVPVPGDTWGSFAFLFRGVLIAGDGIEYGNGRLHAGPAYAADSPHAGRESLRRLGGELAGERVDWVCSSHGGCSGPGEAPRLLHHDVGGGHA